MKRAITIVGALLIVTTAALSAQTNEHQRSKRYIEPNQPEVVEKLEQWQELKFGMIIHFGLYSQLGVVESWSICSEDEEWIPRDTLYTYDQYKRNYWSAIDFFRPHKLSPKEWAEVGKRAGMRYLVFTTKHHDGFNMFDTRYSDFSIAKGAFREHPKRDVAKAVFDAFRSEGYMIGAYYSKPDWHSQDYWWDRFATPNRAQNYNIEQHPERWERFKQFCYNQIEELVGGRYGEIDILWFDGGWVRPHSAADRERAGRRYMGEPDIDMGRIAAMARGYQPSLLIVDRTVAGEYENYQTPERGIPEVQLLNPWESCIPLGNDWGYTPTDSYKSATTIVHTLIEVIAKGGNLLLGIGPRGDGTLPEEVVERLEEIGRWTTKNSAAIYSTRTTEYYNHQNTWFVENSRGDKIYALHCLTEGEPIPTKVVWRGNQPAKGAKVRLVETGKSLRWRALGDGAIEVTLPKGIAESSPAVVFEFDNFLESK